MTRLTVRLTSDQLAFLESSTKPFQHKSDVVRDLIDSARLGLDKPLTLGLAKRSDGASPSSSSSSTKKRTTKSSSLEVQPPLHAHEDLIRDFWKAKQGSKSDAGWKLLNAELLKIQDKYGDRVVREQLELAAANRWKGVSLRNYEQYGLKSAPSQGQKSLDQLAAEMDAMPRLW